MTLILSNTDILNKFGKYSVITGVLLMLVGIAGMVVPVMMSLQVAVFTAVFMLFGGFFWASHTFTYARNSVMDWFKPIILILVATMILLSPEKGVAALGLFLAFYLMLDAFGSFSIAQAYYPAKGWVWMLVNGIVSVLLSLFFILGWPQSSLWLVGLFVAVSLFLDGLVLVIIGRTAKIS